MKEYMKPELEVVNFASEIVTAHGDTSDQTGIEPINDL